MRPAVDQIGGKAEDVLMVQFLDDPPERGGEVIFSVHDEMAATGFVGKRLHFAGKLTPWQADRVDREAAALRVTALPRTKGPESSPSVSSSTTRRPGSSSSVVMATSVAYQSGVGPPGHNPSSRIRASTDLSPVSSGLIATSWPNVPILARSPRRSAATSAPAAWRIRSYCDAMLLLMSNMTATVMA